MRSFLKLTCAPSIAALLLAAGVAAPAQAFDINGFMPARGQGDVAFSYTMESYDHFWVGETKVSDPGVGEVETDSLSVWFQWGFTDSFALVANLPYVDTTSDGLGGFEDSGLQDLSVLGKYRFFSSGPHNLVGAAGFRTAAQDYEANLPVDLGDNTDDLLLRLVYHYQTSGFYFSQQVGYDVRGGDAPDGFPLYTELGYTAGRITYTGFYSRLIADGGTDIGDPGFTFPSNQEEYSRVGAKIYGRVTDRFGLSGLFFTTLDGRNTGETDGFSVGVNFRL
jgi:hypothetical protein